MAIMPRDSATKPFSPRRARLASASADGARRIKRKIPQTAAMTTASASTIPVAVISDTSCSTPRQVSEIAPGISASQERPTAISPSAARNANKRSMPPPYFFAAPRSAIERSASASAAFVISQPHPRGLRPVCRGRAGGLRQALGRGDRALEIAARERCCDARRVDAGFLTRAFTDFAHLYQPLDFA